MGTDCTIHWSHRKHGEPRKYSATNGSFEIAVKTVNLYIGLLLSKLGFEKKDSQIRLGSKGSARKPYLDPMRAYNE
jgi:hypothetical protein